MKKSVRKQNIYISLFLIIFGFFVTFFGSISLFSRQLAGKKTEPLKENEFLKNLDFTIQSGPKSFWKHPTGIKIGRSISSFIHFLFFRNEAFQEKKGGKK